MSKNAIRNVKDKRKSKLYTTGSLGYSTDGNIATASSVAEGDDSRDLFMHFKTDKKQI